MKNKEVSMDRIKEYLSSKLWLSVVIAIIVLCVVFSILSPAFLQWSNFQAVLVQSSITGIMAVGLCFVIMTGGIDISIGAILLLSATVFAYTVNGTESFMLAFLASLSTATLAGVLNGVLVYYFKMAPMITTLATYNIYNGIALHISKTENVPIDRGYTFLGNGRIANIPVPLMILLAITLIGAYLLSHTRFGTFVRAVGDSQVSATESNLPTRRTIVSAYTLAGFTAGLAGVLLISRTAGLQNSLGVGTEFTCIAAVVLGGTALSGGSGSVVGSVFGAVFLILIDNGLNLLQASPFIYDAVRGIVLLAAVSVDRMSTARQAKTLLEQKALRIGSSIIKQVKKTAQA
ncbi:MAG: ABC transporter permease [Spirochaetales bacterium]|nr:ABC transporter permease [Spirochaetales bacterium]